MKKPRSVMRLLSILALCVAMASVAACGDSDDDDGGGSGGASTSSGDSASREKMTVALASTVSDVTVYVAKANGYFDEENLDVEVVPELGTNAVNLGVSGKADLVAYGAGVPITLASQGKDAQSIYGTIGAFSGSALVSNKAGSVDEFKQVDPCRIASWPEGAAAYGYARVYKEKLNPKCELNQMSNQESQLGAVAGGRADATVGALPQVTPLVTAKKAKFIINPETDQDTLKELFGLPVPEVSYWGLKETLDERKDAVVRFLTAMAKGRAFMLDPANEQKVVDILSKDVRGYATLPRKDIETAVRTNRTWYGKWGNGDGSISEEVWADTVKHALVSELPGLTGEDDPNASYDSRINMSYLTEALKGAGQE